jgi:hypothetical protein
MCSSLLTGSLEAIALAIALPFLPANFCFAFPAAEFGVGWQTPDRAQQGERRSGFFSVQSPPNSSPDRANISPADGIYLYGQSPKPEEIKKEYFVFEVRRSKVIGAFYLPRSAFYCFYGTVELTQLNLTVVDSYDGSISPYSVNLQQYYPISAVSQNDRRILGICKATHQQQVWGEKL